MYTHLISCDECCSQYAVQSVSPGPTWHQCKVCGSRRTDVVDRGIGDLWRHEVTAEQTDAEARLVEAIREVFGPGVEELDPEGRPMAGAGVV